MALTNTEKDEGETRDIVLRLSAELKRMRLREWLLLKSFGMTLKGKLSSGEKLLIQNDSKQTRIEVRGGDSASHSSQSSSFDSGKWKDTPKLWAVEDDAVLQVDTDQSTEFFQITEGSIRRLDVAADLQGAKPFELVESDETVVEVSLDPLPPMKKLEMKPMEPFKPMK